MGEETCHTAAVDEWETASNTCGQKKAASTASGDGCSCS